MKSFKNIVAIILSLQILMILVFYASYLISKD